MAKMSARIPVALGGVLMAFALSFASPARGAGVVFNEIMYHPPHDRDGLQYVELFNAGAAEADLSGWALQKGVQFAFPKGTRVAPGGFIVVCRNRDEFVERYASVKPAGQFEGRLSQGGEKLELADASGKVVDWVKYSDRAPWPMSADGRSCSLERICPAAPGADAGNWAPSLLPKIVAPAGTPGRTNDSYSANLPPNVTDVSRSPESPAPGQAVTVSARVADADGATNLTLLWLVLGSNGAGAEHRMPMRRSSGDAQTGRYEATIPGQHEGSFVRYRIEAIDNAGTQRLVPSTNDLRPAWSYATFVNTNTARVPLAFVIRAGGERGLAYPRRASMFGAIGISAARGEDSWIYMPPGGEVEAFDYIRVTPRKGGHKLRLLKDQTFRGMTTLNVVFETPRAALSEPLAYELYRLAGVPAPHAEHWRLWVDGQPLGYQLVFEQINKSFLARHGRDDSGHLYKLLWYGRGIEGQHEKKTDLQGGYEDLLAVVDGLNETKNPQAQWTFIEKNFNVTNFIDYFAVNMCIQNWDGFFNNYFTYHDTSGTGRWEIYPWDEDKTWGDYDGASARYDWYAMPLTFGMNGDQPPGRRAKPGAPSPRFGMGGGAMWWRAPGHFSGPLLANPEFRKRFLARLRELCETRFTPEKMNPVIDAMEQRLEPEISAESKSEFRRNVQSFREQVVGRRKFILEELSRPTP
jgi:hypothetical protein